MTDTEPPVEDPTPEPDPPIQAPTPLVFVCGYCGDAAHFTPTTGWQHDNNRRDHPVLPVPPGTPLVPYNPPGGVG